MKNKVLSITALMLVGVLAFGSLSALSVTTADTTSALTTTKDAAAEQTQRVVTVNGEGKITVTPDLAYIDLGVQSKDKDAKTAQAANAVLMTKVMEAIKKAGIADADIKTTSYSIYQTYDYLPNSEVSNEYYMVNNVVNVKIKDIKKVGEIIDVATAAGANTVNSIRFTVKDDSKYYADALKLAMTNAKSKATAIMSTFDKVPGLPLTISESSYGGSIYYDYAPAKAMMETASTPIESGEITITANVSVGYDYK